MFKAQLKDSKYWKSIFEAINAIIVETNILISPTEFKIMAMDSVHVTMLALTLKKEDFEVYECPEDADYSIGINLTDLLKILKRAGSDDNITFEYEPSDRHIYIKMNRPDSKKTKKFSLALIDLDATKLPLQQLMDIPLPVIMNIDSKFISEAISDAEIYTDAIRITANDTSIMFKSEGSIGEMEYVLEKEEFEISKFAEQAEGTFTITKLKSILKIQTIADKIEFGLGNDTPARFIFNFFGASNIIYFLAPRVDQDTEEYS